MEKVITVVSKKESADNRAYWFSKTPEERLAALEFLRDQYIELTNAPKRLQKILRVVKRERNEFPS